MQADPNCFLEDEALRLARQGNTSAFEFLYRRHCKRVYSLCLRMVKDPIQAEDLTQDTFLAVLRGIHDFRGQSTFTTWLHQVTRNTVLGCFRKKRIQETSLEEVAEFNSEKGRAPKELGTSDRRLETTADRMILQRAVSKLPRGSRTALVLHDLHGYEHKEVAAILGCAAGTSKSRLHKARRRVRELLRKYFRTSRKKESRSDKVTGDDAFTSPVTPQDDESGADPEQYPHSRDVSTKPQRTVPSWCEPIEEKPRTPQT